MIALTLAFVARGAKPRESIRWRSWLRYPESRPAIGAVLLIAMATYAPDAQPEWTVEGLHLANPKLTIEHETKDTPPEKPEQPTRRNDAWRVMTDLGPYEVLYSRYLNRPPAFQGNTPACPTSDWGLGIPGLNTQWYRGNTVRVLIDGQDIVQHFAADAMEVREDIGVARLRFLWRLEKADVAAHVVVLNGRSEGFVEVLVSPHRPLESVGVNLLCYPGGFGPAYGHLSKRVVRVPEAEAKVATGQPSETLTLPPECPWVWYGDCEQEDRGLYNTSSVALVLLPEDKAEGEVNVSSYGVSTQLKYPGTQSRVRLALTAYPGPNARAQSVFAEQRESVRQILRQLDFWPADGPNR